MWFTCSVTNYTELVKTIEEDTAWNYFDSGTLSIELLMNDQLQKYYFRCKDKVSNIVVICDLCLL